MIPGNIKGAQLAFRSFGDQIIDSTWLHRPKRVALQANSHRTAGHTDAPEPIGLVKQVQPRVVKRERAESIKGNVDSVSPPTGRGCLHW